jgi:dolichol-phosphate mannosyltransferase
MLNAGETMLCDSLGRRERYRDSYWRRHDPILNDRLLWRANTFRHSVHLLPGQTILELGCGEGDLTRALLHVTRGENPITSVTFQGQAGAVANATVERHQLQSFPGSLGGRAFDCIIAMDLLDRDSCAAFLSAIYELLVPGGEIVFYESNPWNPMHKLRRLYLRLVGQRDPRNLLDRPSLCDLFSETGFIRVDAVFNDFVFAPLTRPLIWLLRNLSILLEKHPYGSRDRRLYFASWAKTAGDATTAYRSSRHASFSSNGGFRGSSLSQRRDECPPACLWDSGPLR